MDMLIKLDEFSVVMMLRYLDTDTLGKLHTITTGSVISKSLELQSALNREAKTRRSCTTYIFMQVDILILNGILMMEIL